ncbi:MAG: TonB-dependent receptor [Bacteroidetes bacterium]|nr:TonB-dependent receptor [Bacteroidota bacterium]
MIVKTLFMFCIAISWHISTYAQHYLQGTVVDETGAPLPGAIIKLQESFENVQSAADGNFLFKNKKVGTYTVTVTILGYEPKEEIIIVPSSSKTRIQLQLKSFNTGEVLVTANRANEKSGVSYTKLNKKEIEQLNTGVDIPVMLQSLTSMVTTSDAGAGVGYTGMRIRGTDATRINVTLNGVPLNDGESQQLYWVDLPDLATSLQSIQVQRGVGTSVQGAGAFGASVNMFTKSFSEKPAVAINLSGGSFNTFKRNAQFNSGILANHFSFRGSVSKINSDGFVDRAFSNLSSMLLEGNYFSKNYSLRAVLIDGNEKTYQAWNGIPEARFNNDTMAMLEFINRNYLDSADAYNLLNSGSTYNQFTYKNQTDNYRQTHYQLHNHFSFNSNNFLNLSFFTTTGKGFFEEYKKQELLDAYNIAPVISMQDSILNSDLIRRKWLDNIFYGTVFSFVSTAIKNTEIIAGGGLSNYIGGRFNDVQWLAFNNGTEFPYQYFSDTAKKMDANLFLKLSYTLNKFSFKTDVQWRNVDYQYTSVSGKKENPILHFINPKAAITYNYNSRNTFYASVAVANKEPSRDDFVQSSLKNAPLPENLLDFEAGYNLRLTNLLLKVNGYRMQYKNQLILNGKINDVGEYTRVNIPQSYRQGVEIEFQSNISKKLMFTGNLTLSENKIKVYQDFMDDYDISVQLENVYRNVDIAFSPNAIAFGQLTYTPIKNLSIAITSKYVGRQYLDNTSNSNRSLRPYRQEEFLVNHTINVGEKIKISVFTRCTNLLNAYYASNGYTYSYKAGGAITTENFFFPQAGRHFLFGINFRFE